MYMIDMTMLMVLVFDIFDRLCLEKHSNMSMLNNSNLLYHRSSNCYYDTMLIGLKNVAIWEFVWMFVQFYCRDSYPCLTRFSRGEFCFGSIQPHNLLESGASLKLRKQLSGQFLVKTITKS